VIAFGNQNGANKTQIILMCSVRFFVYTILVYFWLLKNEICHNFSTADGLPGESWLGESWLGESWLGESWLCLWL